MERLYGRLFLFEPENPSLDPGPVYAYLIVQNASDEPITEKDRGNPWLDLSETRNEIGFMAPRETHKSMIGTRALHGNRYPLWVERRAQGAKRSAQLARRQGVGLVASADDLARPGLFESDEELADFLAHLYAARHTGLA